MFINCCNIFCASEAVRRLHADATNEELHKLISSWLVGSRDRGGERAGEGEGEGAKRGETEGPERGRSSNRPSHRGTRGATNGH